MRKPKVKTRTYLDWIDLREWLQRHDPDGWKKHGQGLLSHWADGGNLHNGCFISLEGGMQETSEDDGCYEVGDLWLAKIVFEHFPEASDRAKHGDISIWVWW